MAIKNAGLFNKLRNSLLYLGGFFVISVAGYMLYGWDLLDSIYMVVITIFSVGYGEVRPLDDAGKILTIFVIVGGTGAVVYVIGQVIKFVAEGEIMKVLDELRKSRQVEGIGQHAIVCGYGRIGQILAHSLAEEGFPFVVVDLDDGRLAMAQASGYVFVKGSAIEEDTLVQAGIERAVVLATVLPQDTLNVFITLTARNLNRKLRIIARGEQPSTEKKLRQAGADEVVLPAAICGVRIAHSITRVIAMTFLGEQRAGIAEDLKQFGVEIDELRLKKRTHLVGKTVAEISALSEGQMLVVALQRADGSILRTGFMDLSVEEGDAMIIIARSQTLPVILRTETEREELLT
jgi:voltage-gated potassium channel